MKIQTCSVIVFLFTAQCFSQEATVVDLLPLVDVAAHVRSGKWSKTSTGLMADVPNDRAVCVLPYELTGGFEFNCEFTRSSGSDVVGVVLPLGTKQILLELSGWEGQAHGLSRINKAGTLKDDNPTAVRPGELTNGKRYKIAARVRTDGDRVVVKVQLDDKNLVDWSGTLDQVEANIGFNTQSNSRLALVASKSKTTFHSFKVKHAVGVGTPLAAMKSTNPNAGTPNANIPVEGGTVDLTKVAFDKASGTIKTVAFQGEQVIRLEGGGENSVALLPGIEMGDGTIEVDIASDIFSGIAFRAADLKNYELLYFRPQNSGTAKHKNTVQYVSKGVPGKDWRTLRTEFPGEYEAGAKMKVNEWFRARLVIKGESLNVYVDDARKPVLVVDQMFGGRPTGKIGVWGWNTRFRNFEFRPSTNEPSDR